MWSSAPVLVVVAQEVSADSPHKYRIILTLLGPKFWRPNLNLGLLSPKNFGFVSKRMIRRGFQMSVNQAVTINKLTGARCERSLIRKIPGFCGKIGSSTDFFRLGPRRNHGCTVLISMFHAA